MTVKASMKCTGILLVLGMFAAKGSLADTFTLDAASQDNGVKFSIPFKLGTHDGTVSSVTGEMVYDATTEKVTSGKIVMPLAKFATGNAKRDCHTRESLGLNYDISVYPESHVCGSENVLPTTGVDSVQYPEVRFDVTSGKKSGPDSMILSGTLTIHGVTRPLDVPVTLKNQTAKTMGMTGTVPVKLKDFAVEVKPFLFVTVGDVATLTFDINWVAP